jgi:hypothetical protein
MRPAEGRYFPPETINVMRVALDVAWNYLSKEQRKDTPKSLLASRILDAAAGGETDVAQLVRAALVSVPDP